MKQVYIWTDASFHLGRGGWAVFFKFKKHRKLISGLVDYASDSVVMELLAILKALEALKEPCIVEIRTDCRPAIYAIQNGSKNKEFQRVLGKIHKAMEAHKVRIYWVKGHSKSTYNNLVDRESRRRRKEAQEKHEQIKKAKENRHGNSK